MSVTSRYEINDMNVFVASASESRAIYLSLSKMLPCPSNPTRIEHCPCGHLYFNLLVQELYNAGVAQDLEAKGSVSKERAADLPRRTAGGYLALDQHSASVQNDAATVGANSVGGADDEGAAEDSKVENSDAPSADALVRLWPGLAVTARLKLSGEGDSHEHANDEYSIGGSPIGGGESAHRGYAKVAGADAARAVGGLSAALGAVLAGLEEQHRLQRQLQGVRRLPPFARRDAMAALTSQLKALTAARTEACRTLTGLAQSTSLNALLPVSAKQATADALEALALAWQAARSDELGHSNHRSHSSSSGNKKSNSFRSHRGASEGEGKEDFCESVRSSARAAVGAAQEALNDHASKRRNGLAAAGRPRPTAEDEHHRGGEGRSMTGGASTVNESESVQGVPGDASFAVHLSRHCEFAPTFSDVAGLSVAVRRPPQASNGSNFLNPRAMYPQKVNQVNNNAAAAHNAWVLDHKQREQQGSGRYESHSSRRISAASNTMAITPGTAQQQQQKRVQRVSAGRRGLSEGKENGVADKDSGRFDLSGLGLALSASRVMPPGLR